MNTAEAQYRADLDGVRALAVLSVLVYHVDENFLPGGFLGVDVFFVLSGYFITRHILGELRIGNFQIVGFLDRRIRRLFPALFMMLFVTTLAACFIMLPEDLVRYAWTLLAAAFSASNFLFWHSSGYFSPSAEFEPLLHTWSLGVEEQFYLLLPPFLIFVYRYLRMAIYPILAIGIAVSFAVSLYGSYSSSAANFYLLPTRAWELGLGALLAANNVYLPKTWIEREASAAVGMLLILGSLLFVENHFYVPAPWAAPACLGTTMIIWSRLGDRQANPPLVARALSARPFVSVGLISYSLYLWHWPILSLGSYAYLGQLTLGQKSLLMVLAFVMAYLSWRCVETPLRGGQRFWPTLPKRYLVAGFAIAISSCTTAGLVSTGGWPSRFPEKIVSFSAARNDYSPIRGICHAPGDGSTAFEDTCVFGPDDAPGLVVLGDSHGSELSYAFAELAEQTGEFRVRQLTASLCPPSIDFSNRDRRMCNVNVDQWISGLEQETPQTIIMVAFYMKWHEDTALRESFWIGYEKTIQRLSSAGHRVILIDGVPQHKLAPLPTAMAFNARLSGSDAMYAFDRQKKTMKEVDLQLERLKEKYGVQYVPIMDVVCGTGNDCSAELNGAPIYFDNQHITVSVSRHLRDEILLPSIYGLE